MVYLVILAALVLVPVLAIMVFRVNAAIAFMSLCLGSVLVRYTAGDVTSIASGLSSHPSPNVNQWASLVLLITPFLLTILFTRKSISGKKQVTNFLPALASGMLFALLVIPMFSSGLQSQIIHQEAWKILDNLQTAVILGGAFFSLLFLLVSHRHHHSEDKHHKH